MLITAMVHMCSMAMYAGPHSLIGWFHNDCIDNPDCHSGSCRAAYSLGGGHISASHIVSGPAYCGIGIGSLSTQTATALNGRSFLMPYKSLAQERYFNVNRKKMEAQGVNVDEWNQASKGKKLPKRAKKRARARGGVLGR